MPSEPDNLSIFHPQIAAWFRHDLGEPTEVQRKSWKQIAAGNHLLATAPTGGGKTLAAFLWALDRLLTGAWETGAVRVLYVSPLKALNSDIRCNLLIPLEALRKRFSATGEPFPEIEVGVRSGDTPQNERRHMLRRPPEILATTPESLNLLLTSDSGRELLRRVRTVILDEIHAVAATRRGTHLQTAVERLTRIAGEFQRIALSATVKPLNRIAEFVGGFQLLDGAYVRRPVQIVRCDMLRRQQIRVLAPLPDPLAPEEGVWPAIVSEITTRLTDKHSLLIFSRTRNNCEKVTHLLNETTASPPLAYAHHGSLSREIRQEVEKRMKRGELQAVVATNSLELGIDIGAIDEVVMIDAPNSVSSALQQGGRAGHRVDATSRSTILASHDFGLLLAAVTAEGMLAGDVDAMQPPRNPLDILAQILVSMLSVAPWEPDELFAWIRCCDSYHDLPRKQFDLVIDMLCARCGRTWIRALRPLLSHNHDTDLLEARPGARQAIYFSGGTIPDRGYFRLRDSRSGTLLGELDEEFVWEASLGQNFTLGTRSWRIERIDRAEVIVTPGEPTNSPPFWRGEPANRDFHFSERLATFLEEAESQLDDKDFPQWLQTRFPLDTFAAERLQRLLLRQWEAGGGHLPHRHQIVIEHVENNTAAKAGTTQVVLHTLWGGKVNRPFALALQAAWRERYAETLEVWPADHGIYLLLEADIPTAEIFKLVSVENLERQLLQTLEGSGFFGARFRECAGRALLLPRGKPQERRPLWMTRLRSKKLFSTVRSLPDFPITLEAWRTCMNDEFDLPSLRLLLEEIENGIIGIVETKRFVPSPFADTAYWRQVNKFMYEDDTLAGDSKSQLSRDLLQEAVFTPELRPAVPAEIAEDFARKRQRLAPGYAPDSARELIDWIDERGFLTAREWTDLQTAMAHDSDVPIDEILRESRNRIAEIATPGKPLLITTRHEANIWQEPDHELLVRRLTFFGPVTVADFAADVPTATEAIQALVEDWLETGQIVRGNLLRNDDREYICDAENFEIILRLARRAARPQFTPLSPSAFQLFLAHQHGLLKEAEPALEDVLESLSLYPATPSLWEEKILPARLPSFQPRNLDAIMANGEILCFGIGEKRLTFAPMDEFLLTERGAASDAKALFPHHAGSFSFAALQQESRLTTKELTERLAAAVWNGAVTSNSFTALKRALQNKLRTSSSPATAADQIPTSTRQSRRFRRPTRSGFERWRAARPDDGNWQLLPALPPAEDPIEELETKRERVRILLDRYGILFREILERESRDLRWRSIFPALRLMELSGEVVAGAFISGITGLQFTTPALARELRKKAKGKTIFWFNAKDPISLCGIRRPGFEEYPERRETTTLVHRGEHRVLEIFRQGGELNFLTPPDDPELAEIVSPLHLLLEQQTSIRVETINQQTAGTSPYLPALEKWFDLQREPQGIQLRKRYF